MKFFIAAVSIFLLCGCTTIENQDTPGDAEAARWLGIAADEGNTYAQYYYAECCLYGDGVARNEAEALKYLKLAAAKGNTEAIELLQQIEAKKSAGAKPGK